MSNDTDNTDDTDDSNDPNDAGTDADADDVEAAKEIALDLSEDLSPRLMRMIGWALVGIGYDEEGLDRQAEAAFMQSTAAMLGATGPSLEDVMDDVDVATRRDLDERAADNG